ncbi:MAG: Rieske 2Fe-2S domain-containing protein [Acidobacteria bacterium]|nr:Rieske 2Fe-2S domain-containing protein [Acidobacteriota bacterium]
MADSRAPLFDQAELDAVRRPVAEATNLPGGLYVEPAVFALEQESIFAKSWICAGRVDDLSEAGAFMTTEIAGRSVLLVRGEDGAVRGFHNVCRHRGACLVQTDCGTARSFRCNYHGWTYGSDGGLLAAPLMDERPGFDKNDHGLAGVRTEVWGGFVFVNLDPGATELSDAMAGFPDLSRYDLENLRRGHEVSYDVQANWKVLCENYSECYHCALVHPQLNRVTDYRSGGNSFEGPGFNGGPMMLAEGFTTMSTTGERRHPVIEGVGDEETRVHYLHFYPSFLIALLPEYVLLHRVQPDGPGRSRVSCEWFYPESTLAQSDFDASEEIEFWDVTNRQDWGLCEMVQQGAASRLRPGPYHPLEYCVHAFDRWYVERVGKRLESLSR